ncbi:MAG TPA: hypothetical protein VJ987_14995 [Anaerolineales bacterium]|nr:hypothetical protein [Anaerolineales bacterium]
MAKTPWKDRVELLKAISSFTTRNGGFFKQNSKRMSDLFEMSVYNDVVKFYRRKKYSIQICNLMKDGTFKYKLSTAGLKENFSYFKAEKHASDGHVESVEVHHNVKLQSAHDQHIYYTADVSVCADNSVTTVTQKSGKRHSYIESDNLITFFEVKNMNPFPEVLIGFSGIVLEVKPRFIIGPSVTIGKKLKHLTPSIVFSGSGSKHAEEVADKLSNRYGYNVIRGLYISKGQIYGLDKLNSYDG